MRVGVGLAIAMGWLAAGVMAEVATARSDLGCARERSTRGTRSCARAWRRRRSGRAGWVASSSASKITPAGASSSERGGHAPTGKRGIETQFAETRRQLDPVVDGPEHRRWSEVVVDARVGEPERRW